MLFVEVPRARNTFVQYLRKFCKHGAFSEKVSFEKMDFVGVVGEVLVGGWWNCEEWGI